MDDTTGQDVSVDSGAMGQLLDDPRPGHLLEMTTRLTELHAKALHLANAKALTYKGVDIHITHGQLPSSIPGPQSDLFDDLGCNERDRLTRRSSAGVEMPVAFEPFSGDSLHRFDTPKFGRLGSPEMDRLYRHGSIIYQAPVESGTSSLGP